MHRIHASHRCSHLRRKFVIFAGLVCVKLLLTVAALQSPPTPPPSLFLRTNRLFGHERMCTKRLVIVAAAACVARRSGLGRCHICDFLARFSSPKIYRRHHRQRVAQNRCARSSVKQKLCPPLNSLWWLTKLVDTFDECCDASSLCAMLSCNNFNKMAHQQRASQQTVHILFLANDRMPTRLQLSCRALLIIALVRSNFYSAGPQACHQLNPSLDATATNCINKHDYSDCDDDVLVHSK